MNTDREIIDSYIKQAEVLQQEINLLKSKVDRYSIARLIVFAATILIIYLFFSYGFTAVVLSFLLAAICFLWLIKRQVIAQNELSFKRVKYQLLNNEVQALSSFNNIYDNGNDFESAKHPYTDDLDIFGTNSLYAYINRAASSKAKLFLANLLKHATTKENIELRQEAIIELASIPEETLDYRTRLFPLDNKELDKVSDFFNHNLSDSLHFLESKSLQIYLKAVPFISLGLLIVSVGLGGLWGNFLGLFLLANTGIYFKYKSKIDAVHERIGKASEILNNYSINLEWIEKHKWKSKLLQDKQEELRNEIPVYTQISLLNKIIVNLNYRFNIIVAIFLNLLFQWDLKQVLKLLHWNKNYNRNIVNGFNVVSELEVYISLSTLDLNHPKWVYPEISNDFCLETIAIGHPLIPRVVRVDNDFSLRNKPTSDVITGSNMAGKSTFLRTVGVNMVLAFLGAKVSAAHLKTSIFNLYTFMRIKDSLAESTSTFKAEIDRLKMILEETQNNDDAFILIDEMLRGTNSKDKYLGSKAFIERMIEQKTPGFIATHDLQIADLEDEYPSSVRNYHFDISVQEGEMFFDYKIKEGPCKTFNAAILLEKIGLTIK